jgi:hypothetical protein
MNGWHSTTAVGLMLIACGLSAGCTLTPTPGPAALPDWPVFYVATGGNDTNECLSPDTPCATTAEVMRRGRERDHLDIYYGEGTFDFPQEIDHPGYIDRSVGIYGAGKTATILPGPPIRLGGVGVHVGVEKATITNEISVMNGTLFFHEAIVRDSEANGLSVSGGQLRVEGSEILNSQWVGVYNQSGQATIIGSVITGNSRTGISNGGELQVDDTSIFENRNTLGGSAAIAGAGLENTGEATVDRTAIYDNEGKIAIRNTGTLLLLNSTVSGNRLDPEWAAIWNIQNLTLSYTTVAGNHASGIGASRGNLTIGNSLIVQNDGSSCTLSSEADIALEGRNLDSDGTCPIDRDIPAIIITDLRVGPLADNGGPTPTHALLEGSPAIDNALGDCPDTDQRGNTRHVGGGCDIGAYEFFYAESSVVPTPTATEAPEAPEVMAIQNANCRYGPSTVFEVADTLFKDQSAVIKGRNEENTWWQIQGPTFGTLCWVSYITVQVNGNPNAAPVVEGPPPPKEEEPEPAAQGCLVYDQYQNVVCAVPCPANPQPGGACTP